MPTRRHLLTGGLALTLVSGAEAEPSLTDDGLHKQPWFLESFLELSEDLKAATERAKRFAILWELKGCPYCKELHVVNFADPDTGKLVRERFEILQLNFIGSREVTDFDGEKLSEKRLAEKYGVRFTPTIQFFPEQEADLGGRKPRDREVLRMQGYVGPDEFRRMLTFITDREYERSTLREYLRTPAHLRRG